jgi:hypothetical protein
MRAQATITIAAQPRAVLEYIGDLRRYRQADHKITTVHDQPAVSPSSPRSRARYRGRLRGLPTPPQWQSVVLEPWHRLTLASEPGQWTARLAAFEGGFVCEPIGEGLTSVTHYEQFEFHPVLRRLAESFLAEWMQADIEQEMQRLKDLIEHHSAEHESQR